jgi:3-deoxy-7-phosphoheptulonate synthase
MLTKAGLPARIMIDASHANSRKVPARQIDVVNDISTQIGRGNEDIFGIMIESNLEEGRQDVLEGQSLKYGQSITDACVAWRDTEPLLYALAEAVRQRRALRA